MKINLFNKLIKSFLRLILVLMPVLTGCKKFVEVPSPTTSLNAEAVFSNDAQAIAALTAIYGKMSQDGYSKDLCLYPGLSADELIPAEGVTDLNVDYYNVFYNNNLGTLQDEFNFWAPTYRLIYAANAAIEGLTESTTLTPSIKNQLLGEAKFVRAFCYFYLVNFYGGVPLDLTTDYKQNAIRPRAEITDVYNQIITDLADAIRDLDDHYLNSSLQSTEERTRPNRFAASALLSRVYLYTGNYTGADSLASSVILNTNMYDTVPMENVFLKNSKETIWALQPVTNGYEANTQEGRLFIYFLPTGPSGLNPVYLSNQITEGFEVGDKRKALWTNKLDVLDPNTGNVLRTYPYAFKYHYGFEDAPANEYSIIFRIGEQYLIRAEARLMQGKLTGAGSAKEDIDVIRSRAALPGVAATDQTGLLNAIISERKSELFCELGHRWFDLKRLKKAEDVLKPLKGTFWQNTDTLYPIPPYEIDRNPGVRGNQNPGYSN